jgi:hypothetical protein
MTISFVYRLISTTHLYQLGNINDFVSFAQGLMKIGLTYNSHKIVIPHTALNDT